MFFFKYDFLYNLVVVVVVVLITPVVVPCVLDNRHTLFFCYAVYSAIANK